MSKRKNTEDQIQAPEQRRRSTSSSASLNDASSAEDFARHLEAMFRSELGEEEDLSLEPVIHWEASPAPKKEALNPQADSPNLSRGLASLMEEPEPQSAPARKQKTAAPKPDPQQAEREARREAKEQAKREREEKAREEKARKERAAQARKEREEKARLEREERARRDREEKARKEQEELARRERQEKARRERQEKRRAEAEQARREQEEQAAREAEAAQAAARARQEAERERLVFFAPRQKREPDPVPGALPEDPDAPLEPVEPFQPEDRRFKERRNRAASRSGELDAALKSLLDSSGESDPAASEEALEALFAPIGLRVAPPDSSGDEVFKPRASEREPLPEVPTPEPAEAPAASTEAEPEAQTAPAEEPAAPVQRPRKPSRQARRAARKAEREQARLARRQARQEASQEAPQRGEAAPIPSPIEAARSDHDDIMAAMAAEIPGLAELLAEAGDGAAPAPAEPAPAEAPASAEEAFSLPESPQAAEEAAQELPIPEPEAQISVPELRISEPEAEAAQEAASRADNPLTLQLKAYPDSPAPETQAPAAPEPEDPISEATAAPMPEPEPEQRAEPAPKAEEPWSDDWLFAAVDALLGQPLPAETISVPEIPDFSAPPAEPEPTPSAPAKDRAPAETEDPVSANTRRVPTQAVPELWDPLSLFDEPEEAVPVLTPLSRDTTGSLPSLEELFGPAQEVPTPAAAAPAAKPQRQRRRRGLLQSLFHREQAPAAPARRPRQPVPAQEAAPAETEAAPVTLRAEERPAAMLPEQPTAAEAPVPEPRPEAEAAMQELSRETEAPAPELSRETEAPAPELSRETEAAITEWVAAAEAAAQQALPQDAPAAEPRPEPEGPAPEPESEAGALLSEQPPAQELSQPEASPAAEDAPAPERGPAAPEGAGVGADWDPLSLFGGSSDEQELPTWEAYVQARRAARQETQARQEVPESGDFPGASREEALPERFQMPETPSADQREAPEALTLQDFLSAAVPKEQPREQAPARRERSRRAKSRTDSVTLGASAPESISTARENPEGLILTWSGKEPEQPARRRAPAREEAKEPVPSADVRPEDVFSPEARQQIRRRRREAVPREIRSILHPEEAYRVYAKPLDEIGSRMILTGLFTLLSLFLTLYLGQGWTFLPGVFSGGTTVYILMAMLLVMVLINRKLYFSQWRDSDGLRPELLLMIATVFSLLDCFSAAQSLRPPFTVVIGALLMVQLWGLYDRGLALITTVKVLREELSAGVSEVQDITKGSRGLIRTEPDVDSFMGRLETRDLTDRVLRVYTPAAAIVGLILTLVVSLGLKQDFFWSGSLIFLGSVPVTGLLVFPRLFCLLAGRLAEAQAALCGYHGAEVFGGEHSILIGDDDIFPAGSLTLNGFKVYSGNPDRVIAYAAAAFRSSGSALDPVFEDLLLTHNGKHYTVDNFRFYDSGGIGASILQDVVLLGSLDFMRRMGVHMDRGAKVKQAVYMSLNGELAAVFAVRYAPPENLRRGLAAIAGNRHFKGILVTRTFLGTPGFLKAKFGIPTGAFAYPSTKERIRLSEAEMKRSGAQGAILAKDSFSGFAQAAAGGRLLRSATLGGAVLTVLGGLTGLILMGILAALPAYETATAVNLLLYTAAWLAPTLLLTSWARHF